MQDTSQLLWNAVGSSCQCTFAQHMMWNSLWSQEWFCIHPRADWSVSSVNLLGINHLFRWRALGNYYQICPRQLCTSCLSVKPPKHFPLRGICLDEREISCYDIGNGRCPQVEACTLNCVWHSQATRSLQGSEEAECAWWTQQSCLHLFCLHRQNSSPALAG